MRPTMDRELAHAAATDAGFLSMKAAGRSAWNLDDRQAAVETFDRLYPLKAEIEDLLASAKSKP